MSNVPPLGSTFSIPGQSGQVFSYLTPDALMTYCSTRLQGLDAQVQQAFHEQEESNRDSQIISDALNASAFGVNVNGWDPSQYGGGSALIGDLQNAINQLPPGDARDQLIKVRDQIADRMDSKGQLKAILDSTDPQQAYQQYWCHFDGSSGNKQWTGQSDNSIVANVGGTANANPIDPKEVASWSDAVKSAQSGLNSASELNMISLQSLMSQRQEAIQLCTNLVQSLGDQCNKIAQNIGH